MSTETTFETSFTRRWKRPSRRVVLIVGGTMLGLFVAVGLPRMILPKFSNKPTALNFQVQVIDDQGIPIPNANVYVGAGSGQTDHDGHCDVPQEYLAKGIKGLSGTCRLEGEIRVEAPGFIAWRKSLADVFGHDYDYAEKGTNVVHQVTLLR